MEHNVWVKSRNGIQMVGGQWEYKYIWTLYLRCDSKEEALREASLISPTPASPSVCVRPVGEWL